MIGTMENLTFSLRNWLMIKWHQISSSQLIETIFKENGIVCEMLKENINVEKMFYTSVFSPPKSVL